MSIYTMDFDAMLYRLKDLEKLYNAELELLESHTPGCLYGVKRDGRQNYLQTQIINGKQQRHGITNDPDTLRRLCRKAYLKGALENINENINCLAAVKLQFTSLQPAEIIQNLPKVYQTLPKEYFFPDLFKDRLAEAAEKDAEIAAKVKAWIEEPYEQSTFMPHNKEYMARHKRKMELYESVGIVPWDNLIVTYGDINGNIDVRAIESELISKLL